MTPQEMATIRPRLVAFAAEMLGGLARKDQRAAGELYVRGLLAAGQRKSMQPMAARLGIDHQRLQQFITSSTWDYVAVRRNVARHFAASQLADKGLAGRDMERYAAGQTGVLLARPDRKDERRRFGNLAGMRQWIEAIIGTLKDQLGLERHRGRTPAGVFARIAQRLLAMAACIWNNWRTSPATPAKRSLTAYDH